MSEILRNASPAGTALGWTMLHLLWVGTVIGVVALVGRRLLRATAPETRYGFALICLLLFTVAPVAIFAQMFTPNTPARPPLAPPVESERPAFSTTSSTSTLDTPQRPKIVSLWEQQTPKTRWVTLEALTIPLAWIWLIGSLLTLSLLGTGLIGLEGLRRSSRIIEAGPVASRCRSLADAIGAAGTISVGVCERLAVPILIGILRPLILLPPESLTLWSVEQLEMALLHELAHLRRWDNLVNLVQRLIESLLFFHPVVWWLSGWIRLERETCCDRLVVARTGRACAYVEMLVALSGSSHGQGRVALAMADHQVMTRVRRILNLEDRSMKWTLPEGLGLLGATIVGLTLVLQAHSAPPPKDSAPQDAVRQALQKAANDVTAIKTTSLYSEVEKVAAFASIAQAQFKLGDPTAARATLQLAFAMIDTVKLEPTEYGFEGVECLIMVASVQREAGDSTGARATLDRLLSLIERIKADPNAPSKVDHIDNNSARMLTSSGMVLRAVLLLSIATERMALGDLQEARALGRRAVTEIGKEQGPLKSLLLTQIGFVMAKSGDSAAASEIFEQAHQAVLELTDPHDRQKGLSYIASSLSAIGDVEGAIRLVRSLSDEISRVQALQQIIDGFVDEHGPWLSYSGITIRIGAERLTIKDQATAKRALPKIAQAAQETLGPLSRGRLLSTIAHLQAKAGDFAGALATIEAIPDLKRADFPGPSDGFYDAIKPATVAMVAHLQFEAGDKDTAKAGFDRAVALSRAITTPGERIVADIAIAQKQVDAGLKEAAQVLLDETIALTLNQPEPRRSRSLSELAAIQIQADDTSGAAQTAENIRNYPCLDKVAVLRRLADWHEKAGNRGSVQSTLRQALSYVEAKAPQNPSMGPLHEFPKTISSQTFIDPDLEIDPKFYQTNLESMSMALRARLGDHQGVLDSARALPEKERNAAMKILVSTIAAQGDILQALSLASTLESPEDRLTGIAQAAYWVKSATKTK